MKHNKLLTAALLLAALMIIAIAVNPQITVLADTPLPTDLNATPLAAPVVSSWSVSSWTAPADGSTQVVVLVSVNDADGDLAKVTLDLSKLGGGAATTLLDDGVHSDGGVNDGMYGLVIIMPSGVPTGEIPLTLSAVDVQGNQTVVNLGTFAILSPSSASWPATLPNHLGWGTGEYSWQETTDLPWNYNSHYLTWNWQDWNANFVSEYVQEAWAKDEIPVLTFDMLLGAADCNGLAEKECDFAHLQNATIMQGYFDRVTEAANQAAGSQAVIFSIESDVSAYMQRYSIEHAGQDGILADEPDTIPAQSLDPAYPNSYAGAVQRMVDIIHTHAPNALVALHVRTWATGKDVGSSTDVNLDVAEIGYRTAYFLAKAGGESLDLLVTDWKVWDAGSGDSPWWDNTNRTLPHYSRVLYWQNQIAYHSGLSLILWNVPAGNMSLENTCQRYQDNRVDYAFEHPSDLLDSGIIGVVVSGGGNCRTIPSTDNNNILTKGTVFFTQPTTPAEFTAVTTGAPGLVRLSWQANAEYDVLSYQVYIGRDPQNMSLYMDVQRQTSLQLMLPDGGTWYVSVKAVDAYGLGSSLANPVMVQLDPPFKVTLPMVVH